MFYFWACTILPACLYYLINLMMSSTLGLCIGLAVPFICQFLVDRIIRYNFLDYVFGPKSENKIQDWRYEIFKFLWSQENVLDFLYKGVLQSPLSVHILLPAFTSSYYLLSAATDDSAQLAKKNFFFKKCECFMCVGRLILGAALLGLVDLIWIVSAELTRKGLF